MVSTWDARALNPGRGQGRIPFYRAVPRRLSMCQAKRGHSGLLPARPCHTCQVWAAGREPFTLKTEVGWSVGGTNRELGVFWGTQAAVIPKWSCAPEELCHYLSGHGSPQKMSGTFPRGQRQIVSGHPTVPANSSGPKSCQRLLPVPKAWVLLLPWD